MKIITLFFRSVIAVLFIDTAVWGDGLADDFKVPPADTRPGTYWYFLKDDVSETGITMDLEAMQQAGIGRAFIGYINQGENPPGDNQVFSDRWWERLAHTFREGDRLGIDIGLFNCPGWSQSGGPWITPERSMRNLVSTEIAVAGPVALDEVLPGRDGYFETVKVLAFPRPPQEKSTMRACGVNIAGPADDLRPGPFSGGSVGFRVRPPGPNQPDNPSGLIRALRVMDGEGRLVFEDDFTEGLGQWSVNAEASVTNGLLCVKETREPALMSAKEVRLPERFSIEVEVKLNPGGILGLGFGVKDGQNQAFWQIRKGLLRPHLKRNGRFVYTTDHPAAALVESKWQVIRIECDGHQVSAFVDGDLIHSVSEQELLGPIDALFDGNPKTAYAFPDVKEDDAPFVIDFSFEQPFPVQSIIAQAESGRSGMSGELEASDDGIAYRKVCDVNLYHGHQGAKVLEPMAGAVPTTKARHYRLKLTGFRDNRAFSRLELSSRALLDKYVIKQLGDSHPTPFPVYGTFQWETQDEPGLPDSVIAADTVVDLTDRMDADGRLCWKVPPGEWVITRYAMVSTGAKNGPAMPDATGLECDKLSAEHIRFHFDRYIGEVLRRIPAEERKSFKYIIQDSYEMGPQNWTDDMLEHFKKRYDYDPVPWLPVTTGRIVGSAEQSDRFLWDLRRLVADRMASEYVGGLTGIAEENGLIGWLENYGHWGFPGESLLYGKYSTEIGGEFWLGPDLGRIEPRQAASSAHIYGKKEVYAEAFTSGERYTPTPRNRFKHFGDWAFCEGINHFILHLFIHQPRDDEKPGVDAWFGSGFNRHNTWFNLIYGYLDYTRRVNHMMRQGVNVADVCYYIGEGSPKMDGPREPRLPRGYDFDFVNADVILNHMTVKGGRICIPNGPDYKVMVLPDVKTMRPEIAAKLLEFARGGAVISGPRPQYSPSMQDYPACDEKLVALADQLWGGGLVTEERDLHRLLKHAGVSPDFAYRLDDAELNGAEDAYTDLSYAYHPQKNSLRFAHRKTGTADIYFVANMQTDRAFNAGCTFRVGHKVPEIWDPVTGEMRKARAFTRTQEGVKLPMHFEARQSWIFVFREPARGNGYDKTNAIEKRPLMKLGGTWSVRFDPALGGPETATFPELVSWPDHEDAGIRYYSGEAVYKRHFELKALPGKRCWLDLGEVADMAEVTLNGKALGIVWLDPWRIEITDALKAGENRLEIKVANTWNNRLLGDQRGQGDFAENYTPYSAKKPLPAGLLGPVSIWAEK